MRATSRLLATAAKAPAAHSLRPPPVALLPPIPLYRRILRAHRKLPFEMRFMGDKYVKSEFKLHKDAENPIHIVGFLTQWQLYLQQIEGDTWVGDKLDPAVIEKMSDQQIGQLYELMQAIRQQELDDDEAGPSEPAIDLDRKA